MQEPEGVLWDLVAGTASTRGSEFFGQLTRLVAAALGVPVAVVAEVAAPVGEARTLSAWVGDSWVEAGRFDLRRTPCGRVVDVGATFLRSSGVRAEFPLAPAVLDWGVDSYLGSPLRTSAGAIIGTLCVMDRAPFADGERARTILEAFAGRAAVELERIRNEHELERQRAFLRQILDINPSFIFVKDRDGRFRLVNRAVADAYGTSVEGLTGRTDADFNPKSDEVAFFRKMDLEVMDTRQERQIAEEPVTDATGRVRWMQTIKRPVVGDDGRVDLVLGVSTDISELRRAREELFRRQLEEQKKVQDELARVKDELVRQTRLAAIGQVAASIAHELRNPLGSINNAVFYLRRRLAGAEPKVGETLEIVAQEVRTADRIIGDLLEMSRGKSPTKGPIDLGALARRVFDALRPDAALRLRLELEPEPFLVDADADQLRQVLANLLTNALQAMPGGGEVRIEARREGGVDLLTVVDEGPGVPPELRTRVFEPLFSTKAKGTGLGLTICRQIVENHGGAIWVVPSERGAALRIRLPARLPGEPA